MKIEKVERCKRGYGSMTVALFRTEKSPPQTVMGGTM